MKRRSLLKGLLGLPVAAAVAPYVAKALPGFKGPMTATEVLHRNRTIRHGIPVPQWRKLNQGICPNPTLLDLAMSRDGNSEIVEILNDHNNMKET